MLKAQCNFLQESFQKQSMPPLPLEKEPNIPTHNFSLFVYPFLLNFLHQYISETYYSVFPSQIIDDEARKSVEHDVQNISIQFIIMIDAIVVQASSYEPLQQYLQTLPRISPSLSPTSHKHTLFSQAIIGKKQSK